MATIASSLEHKSNVELKKLKTKLKDQLQRDVLREIYCNTEIRSKEEELLQCIETAFSLAKSTHFQETYNCEPSHYLSLNDTSVPKDDSDKFQLLKDITKVNAINGAFVNYNYFRTSDNTVYYSLVDESLVLSDFSDINEEAFKEMSCRREFANSTKLEMDDHETAPPLETQKEPNVDVQALVIAEHLTIDDLSCECPNAIDDLSKENVKTATSKYFQADAKPSSNDIGAKKINKFFKCFIDASDLIEPDEACNDDKTDGGDCNTKPNNAKVSRVRSEKQTPDSLDDDPCIDGIECAQPEQLQSKLQNDFLRATLRLQSVQSDDGISSQHTPYVSGDRLCHSVDDAFASFKNHLVEKYECARKNHAYSDDELQRLKIFDEMVTNDAEFAFLKRNLDDVLVAAESSTKMDVAVHRFLTKQYEKKHGPEKVYTFVKALMIDALERRRKDAGAQDQTPNSLNGDEKRIPETCNIKEDVDELLKKLLRNSSTPNPYQEKLVVESEAKPREPVTSKSCGFFIDLKDDAKKSTTTTRAGTKEKSFPSKQLFSMFIDLGNSTDSDSSIEAQSKFEKRRNQYISKLEKSRELRSSVSSLNEFGGNGEGRKLEKIVQSTPLSCSVSTAEKVLKENQHSTPGLGDTAAVVRRCKNGSSRPPESRRSWNVDKTCEVNRNSLAKHKRSYSVSSRNGNAKCAVEIDTNAGEEEMTPGEFPSIGNADSTNELTVNGESEISNSYSHSEREDQRTQSSTSISGAKSNGDMCPKMSASKSEDNGAEKTKEKIFVKLSDMDKEPKTLSLSMDQWTSIRMTKSATVMETNWFETKLLNGSVNSRSLSRIFPDLSVSVLSKPNSDVDDTTVSSISSVQSSSAVSICESNLEVSNCGNKDDCNTLGQDLLRMFLEEISTDVVVEVAGRRIKAHKCILTSRCQYFAALLSGGWVESAGNVLSIQGFSYSVVHFALCYIYSGESEIPENINIVELATLADYLCLEGLKEIVSCTLKMKYCHFFHKPCNICSVGVLECLPIAVNYGLDDIHRKSLRWITKHYVRLWCSKAFATLPRELIDKCYNQHVVNMTVNNVFEALMNCDKLFSFIPQTRWAEPCFVVTKKLHDYCIKYLANHFVEFLKSESFTSIAFNRTWGITIVEEKTKLACSKMRSDQLCQCYAHICNEYKLAESSNKNEESIELLNRVKLQIETALVKIALQASQCNAWFQMEPEMRSHIQSLAGLTFVPSEVRRRVDSFKPRQSSVTSSSSRAADLQQVKSAINRQNKQTGVRSHEVRQTKQNSNQKQNNVHAKSVSTKQNGIQNKENKGSKSSSTNNSKSPFRNKYANVKSRYMEQNVSSKSDKTASETTPSETSEVEKRPSTANKRSSKSLVSSVNLSPAIRQTVRAVSLSKIPISVRNSSQKRNESDKDTTSGSDNGVKSERITPRVNRLETSRPSKRLTSSAIAPRSSSSSARSKNFSTIPRDDKSQRGCNSKSTRIWSKTENTTVNSNGVRCKPMTNGTSKRFERRSSGKLMIQNGANEFDSELRSKNSSPETKCPSNPSSKTTSLSEDIPRPEIPFRRDGTFCIDEPTVLKKHSPSSDHADEVV